MLSPGTYSRDHALCCLHSHGKEEAGSLVEDRSRYRKEQVSGGTPVLGIKIKQHKYLSEHLLRRPPMHVCQFHCQVYWFTLNNSHDHQCSIQQLFVKSFGITIPQYQQYRPPPRSHKLPRITNLRKMEDGGSPKKSRFFSGGRSLTFRNRNAGAGSTAEEASFVVASGTFGKGNDDTGSIEDKLSGESQGENGATAVERGRVSTAAAAPHKLSVNPNTK